MAKHNVILSIPKSYKLRIREKMAKYVSKDNEYYTPKEFVKSFGDFEYDPATTKEKAEEFGVKHYDTIETNGLTKEWNYKRIWINPPFTLKHKFLEKAVETYKKYHNDIFILFPIEFMTTKRFHTIMEEIGGEIFLPNGRIKFQSGLGKKSSSPSFGTVVMKLQDKDNYLYVTRITLEN